MSDRCPTCGDFLDEDDAVLDQTTVMELAAAIARGDCTTAAQALDVMIRDLNRAAEIRDWIAQGRASVLARPRPLSPAIAPRAAQHEGPNHG